MRHPECRGVLDVDLFRVPLAVGERGEFPSRPRGAQQDCFDVLRARALLYYVLGVPEAIGASNLVFEDD